MTWGALEDLIYGATSVNEIGRGFVVVEFCPVLSFNLLDFPVSKSHKHTTFTHEKTKKV